MSARQRSIYRLLMEHEYIVGGRGGSICICGFVPVINAKTLATQQDYHRGHVAEILALRLLSATEADR